MKGNKSICGRCEKLLVEFGSARNIMCDTCLDQIKFSSDNPCRKIVSKARIRFNQLYEESFK